MVLHKIRVQCREHHLNECTSDDDEYSYIILYQNVLEGILGLEFMEREVEIKFKAYIRGGEHIINVDNDKSLMDMFRLNTNQND